MSNTQIEKRPRFRDMMQTDGYKNMINNTLQDPKRAQSFIASITSAVVANQSLNECEPYSILSSALLGEALGLSPSPQLGQYYMVPYENKKKGIKVAQFQLGYKGYIQLAIRSGQYKKINVLAIKKGELIHFDPLNEEIEVRLIDDQMERESAETIGYYAMFEYMNGFRKAIYWSKSKMEAHADKYSAAFSLDAYRELLAGKIPQDKLWKYSSFWYKNFDDMAFKTMLRQLISRWGIMSVEMQNAFEKDMGVINQDGSVDYIDNDYDDAIIPQHDEPSPGDDGVMDAEISPEAETQDDENAPTLNMDEV